MFPRALCLAYPFVALGYGTMSAEPAVPAIAGLEAPSPAEDSHLADLDRRMELARLMPVPLPEKTQYDGNAEARRQYLENYARGYREILAEVFEVCHMQVFDGYEHARLNGIKAGGEQAIKDHPEHWRRMCGVEAPGPAEPSAAPKPR